MKLCCDSRKADHSIIYTDLNLKYRAIGYVVLRLARVVLGMKTTVGALDRGNPKVGRTSVENDGKWLTAYLN